MDFCKAARAAGQCKQELISGLYRTIEANLPYSKGEFDLQFRDNKMYIQDWDKEKEAMEVGDLKKTGDTASGGVKFQIENWKSDPKIWPHDELHGMF